MKINYTEEAVADIVQAITYLNERNPTAAEREPSYEPTADIKVKAVADPAAR